MLTRALRAVQALVFPRAATCAVCGDARRADEKDCLCDACRERLRALRVPPEACERCLSLTRASKRCALCAGEFMRRVERVYAPYIYRDAAAKIIKDFKFEACDDMLPLLCDSMAESLKTRDFDCIAPVPLHASRERERGVNQAMLLAQGVSDRIGAPVANPLRRVRATRPQTSLNQAKRRQNVRGAFVCDQDMTGKNVLLVDDVRTVGATAAACAEALHDKGAAAISLLVAAVVLHPGGGKHERV